MKEDCIFCKIVDSKLPSKKVFENEHILAFDDINPAAPVHVIIIPKKHIEKVFDIKRGDEHLLGDLILAANQIALGKGISDAFKLTTNNGKKAGQVVPHLHFHLLGGWKNKKDAVSELHKK